MGATCLGSVGAARAHPARSVARACAPPRSGDGPLAPGDGNRWRGQTGPGAQLPPTPARRASLPGACGRSLGKRAGCRAGPPWAPPRPGAHTRRGGVGAARLAPGPRVTINAAAVTWAQGPFPAERSPGSGSVQRATGLSPLAWKGRDRQLRPGPGSVPGLGPPLVCRPITRDLSPSSRLQDPPTRGWVCGHSGRRAKAQLFPHHQPGVGVGRGGAPGTD